MNRDPFYNKIVERLNGALDPELFPIGMPDPIEAIRIRMEDLGLTRKHLTEHLGKSSGRISDILNRWRPLTLGDVRTLSRLLAIPTEVLAQECPPVRAKQGQAGQSCRRG